MDENIDSEEADEFRQFMIDYMVSATEDQIRVQIKRPAMIVETIDEWAVKAVRKLYEK
jgi:hypothetical protein